MESREEIKQIVYNHFGSQSFRGYTNEQCDVIYDFIALITNQQNKALTDEVAELKQSNQEADEKIEELEKLHKQKVENIGILNKDRHRLLQVIEQLKIELKATDSVNAKLQSRIDELQKINEWISVELAPKDGTYILGYNDDSDLIKIVYWNSSMGNGCWNGDRHIEKISHWMPLPNKPKTN